MIFNVETEYLAFFWPQYEIELYYRNKMVFYLEMQQPRKQKKMYCTLMNVSIYSRESTPEIVRRILF